MLVVVLFVLYIEYTSCIAKDTLDYCYLYSLFDLLLLGILSEGLFVEEEVSATVEFIDYGIDSINKWIEGCCVVSGCLYLFFLLSPSK